MEDFSFREEGILSVCQPTGWFLICNVRKPDVSEYNIIQSAKKTLAYFDIQDNQEIRYEPTISKAAKYSVSRWDLLKHYAYAFKKDIKLRTI